MTMRCKACGVTIQTTDPDGIGYALREDQPLCRACFRLRHYGEDVKKDAHENLLDIPIGAQVLLMTSVLHMDVLFNAPFSRNRPDLSIVLVINQTDLLPKDTNKDVLLENVMRRARKEHIDIRDIILMSSLNAADVENLKSYLQKTHKSDVYLLGVQNAGKTTLFRALTGDTDALAMKRAGLTQRPITGTMGHLEIHDMPGIDQKGYLHTFLPYETYKRLIPDKTIDPRIYTVRPGQSLMLEGLVGVTNTGKDTCTCVFYVKKELGIEKTNLTRVIDRLQAASKTHQASCDVHVRQAFPIKEHTKMRLTFADMGFMHVSGPAHISVDSCKAMHISLTEALFR
jgi:30S ribosome assembly GTPase